MTLALANLAIQVNVNADSASKGMRQIQQETRSAMTDSQEAVLSLQEHLMRAAADMQAAAAQIGGGMQAANDAVMSSARDSEQALQQLQAQAAQTEAALSQAQEEEKTRWQEMADFIGQKVNEAVEWVTDAVTLMAAKWAALKWGGELLGAVARLTGEIYLAYKTIEWGAGLITGEAYKSENIDALVEANDRVKSLQETMRVSAQDASALDNVQQRLGVSIDALKSAYEGADSAAHQNTQELDRLGVNYKDVNGELISQHDMLVNAKSVLDQYTEGWDRHQAALAIGMGSYEQISEALKVTDEEMSASKQRLDEYQLAIGPASQAAVAEYEQAMRDFRNESRLTSEGFKRAIADNIMPILTDLAKYFQEGFPFAVKAFRASLATVSSGIYVVKLAADLVVDAVKGASDAIGSLFGGMAKAMSALNNGDVSGAAKAVYESWQNAGAAVKKTTEEMIADAQKAGGRMQMAWGIDDRTNPEQGVNSFMGGNKRGKGKAWVPAPKEDKTKPQGQTTERSQYENFLNQLDQANKKLQEDEYAALRLKAAQLAAKEGITDTMDAQKKINQLQRNESTKVVEAYAEKLAEARAEQDWQTQIMGKTIEEQELLNVERQAWLEAERLIQQAKKSSKPLSDDAVDEIRAETAATIEATKAAIEKRRAYEKTAEYGANKALQEYAKDANDEAKKAGDLLVKGFQAAEDAVVQFAKTGKLSVGSFFASVAEEYLRTATRTAMVKLFSDDSGKVNLSNGMSNLSSMWSMASNAMSLFGIPLATGTNYVPYDGMPATLHKGEAVVPAAYNPAAGGQGLGGSGYTDNSTNNYSVGAGVSRGEMMAAISQANAQQEQRMRKLMNRGMFA